VALLANNTIGTGPMTIEGRKRKQGETGIFDLPATVEIGEAKAKAGMRRTIWRI